MATLHRTVVRPIVTEKTSIARQDRGEYVFEVAPDRPNWKKAIVTLQEGDTIEGIFEG